MGKRKTCLWPSEKQLIIEARADTAVHPYAEVLHSTGKQYSLQCRRRHVEIYINLASAALTSINGITAPKAREGVAALPYTEFFISDQ
jgi:hypothetical protein